MRYLVLLLILATGCNRTYNINPVTPTQFAETSIIISDRVEYRVLGNAQAATIRYGNTLDGISQITTTIPFSNTLTVNASSVFLSLDVAASNLFSSSPFLSAQIFVNGVLFREASSSSTAPVLSVSGTFRH